MSVRLAGRLGGLTPAEDAITGRGWLQFAMCSEWVPIPSSKRLLHRVGATIKPPVDALSH